MKYLIAVLILLVPTVSIANEIEGGFYNQHESNCSNGFVKLLINEGKYLDFYRREGSSPGFNKNLSLTYNVMTELETGELIMQMGGVNFLLKKGDNDTLNMIMHADDTKPIAGKLYKCTKFNESTMAMFNDLQDFSTKYPGVNFGVGHSGSFTVQP